MARGRERAPTPRGGCRPPTDNRRGNRATRVNHPRTVAVPLLMRTADAFAACLRA